MIKHEYSIPTTNAEQVLNVVQIMDGTVIEGDSFQGGSNPFGSSGAPARKLYI